MAVTFICNAGRYNCRRVIPARDDGAYRTSSRTGGERDDIPSYCSVLLVPGRYYFDCNLHRIRVLQEREYQPMGQSVFQTRILKEL